MEGRAAEPWDLEFEIPGATGCGLHLRTARSSLAKPTADLPSARNSGPRESPPHPQLLLLQEPRSLLQSETPDQSRSAWPVSSRHLHSGSRVRFSSLRPRSRNPQYPPSVRPLLPDIHPRAP